ncbi:MAG TPA: hypothetical protein VMD76_08495 [Candidatus Sulfotelmatobacter sp.]|jgi:hypothetical protein|nr:hypothetical protein [Candidatus Sulfotelmatobacter sp.]
MGIHFHRWSTALLLLIASVAVAQEPSSAPAPENSTSSKPAPPDLTPGPDGKLTQEQMQQLLRVVAEKDIANDKLQRNYTYTEREVQSKLDGSGQTKSTEVKTLEILDIDGEQVERLIAKDDKPLDAKEAAKEDEKIQKIIDKRKNESDDERRKREEKEAKDREDGLKFVREIADAYNFTLVGSETIGDRDTWVISAEPRPGFEPHMKDAKFLSKFHGRVWIDKSDLQLAKMDVECLDTISVGLFLARFHKGSRFMLEQTRVNDEVWLPLHVTGKVDARIALLKSYDEAFDQTYRDYKKFQTSSRIVNMGEVKEQRDPQEKK